MAVAVAVAVDMHVAVIVAVALMQVADQHQAGQAGWQIHWQDLIGMVHQLQDGAGPPAATAGAAGSTS